MTYHPSAPLKMTNGITPSSNKASYLYKYAAAVPSENPNVCLIRFYQEILKHLDMLNPSDKPNQKIFQSLNQGRVRPGECFFRDRVMCEDNFNNIFKDTMHCSGIDLAGLKISNQSLRVTAFSIQHNIGFTEEETASVAGHGSTATQRIYKRKVLNAHITFASF